jgi:transcriptional regulator with XRE-family HTH domain
MGVMIMTPDDIRRLRFEMRMTLAEFGEKFGVTESAVSRWEAGITHPRYNAVVKMNQLWAEVQPREKAGVA